jgi:hypothetical protein
VQYIFDQATSAGLMSGQLSFKEEKGDDTYFFSGDHQWPQLTAMPDNALKLYLRSYLCPGRSFVIWEFPDRESILEQNGYELPDIVTVYRKTFGHDPTPAVYQDLAIMEVALNEEAALVTDEPDLRKLIVDLDGEWVASTEVLNSIK